MSGKHQLGGRRMSKQKIVAIIAASALLISPFKVQASEPIKEVKQLVQDYYYPSVSSTKLAQATTIKSVMNLLDPYSTYMTNSEYNDFFHNVEMQVIGIGVTVKVNKRGLEVTEIIRGGGAEANGLKVGDLITTINDKILANFTLNQSTSLLKGKKDTKVKVGFYRPSTKKEYTKNIVRKLINIPNVETKKLSGSVGYIRLNSFSSTSATEIQKAIKSMPSAKKWIFDLRGNGGGDVAAAEKIIGLFKGNNLAYFFKNAHDKALYYVPAVKQKTQFNGPVAVLIDSNSASSSEMTAGALKGQKLATIYGQKSFGKGVMQSFFQTTDKKGYVKLTVAEFFAPSSKLTPIKINKKGITPTIKTAKGQELIVSHQAILKKSFSNYTKMPTISQKGTTKDIIIKPVNNFNWSKLSTSKVYLMQIGGPTRKITIKKTALNQLKIHASSSIKANTKYYIKLIPKKGKNAYMYVTISK